MRYLRVFDLVWSLCVALPEDVGSAVQGAQFGKGPRSSYLQLDLSGTGGARPVESTGSDIRGGERDFYSSDNLLFCGFNNI